MSNVPNSEPKNPNQPHKPSTDPDPKAHPIHAPIPVQPIHEGTDPSNPVTPENPRPQ